MSENNSFTVSLVGDTTFVTKVSCKVPSGGVDAWRTLEFKATYRVLSEEEQESMPMNITTRDVLRKVLLEVEGVPPATLNGEELSPVDVVIYNQFTSDAAYAIYKLRTTQNGRDISSSEAMKAANTRGNSSRSRGR